MNLLKAIGQLYADIETAPFPHQSAAEKRALNAQMDYYKQQKDALLAENDRISKQRDSERQRLHEKQIRSLRRSYRSPGLLEGPQGGTQNTTG